MAIQSWSKKAEDSRKAFSSTRGQKPWSFIGHFLKRAIMPQVRRVVDRQTVCMVLLAIEPAASYNVCVSITAWNPPRLTFVRLQRSYNWTKVNQGNVIIGGIGRRLSVKLWRLWLTNITSDRHLLSNIDGYLLRGNVLRHQSAKWAVFCPQDKR